MTGRGVVPPPAVAEAANTGLAPWNKFRRGGNLEGLRRAHELAERRPIPWRDVVTMGDYFDRHSVDGSLKAHAPRGPEQSLGGLQAWLLHGGDPGRAWALELKARAERTKSA